MGPQFVYPMWDRLPVRSGPTSLAARAQARSTGSSAMRLKTGSTLCAVARKVPPRTMTADGCTDRIGDPSHAPRIPCAPSWAAGCTASASCATVAKNAATACLSRSPANGAWPAHPATASARRWEAPRRRRSCCPKFPTGNGFSSCRSACGILCIATNACRASYRASWQLCSGATTPVMPPRARSRLRCTRSRDLDRA